MGAGDSSQATQRALLGHSRSGARGAAGDTYLLLDRSLRHVVQHLARGLGRGRLRTNWPVRRIEHGTSGALLHGPGGQRVHCRAVVVTVPLAQLQAGALAFSPPLPAAKRGALTRLKMSNAVKARVCVANAVQDLLAIGLLQR